MIRFSLLRASMLVAFFATAACGGTTQFAGGKAFAINGTFVSPPAPEPAKESEPAPRVELRDNKLELKEKIQFEANVATIKKESYSLLHEIAEVIRKNPQVKRIAIEGHASSDGGDIKNLKLSRARAKSVRLHLVKKEGLSTDLLFARGWGEEKPVADNETLEGREANRRVEFIVVEQDVKVTSVEIDPKTGHEKVLEEKTDTVKVELQPTPKIAKSNAKAKQ